MTKSVPAILVTAGIMLVLGGISALTYADAVNSAYSDLMKYTTGKEPTHQLFSHTKAYLMLGFGAFFSILGAYAYKK